MGSQPLGEVGDGGLCPGVGGNLGQRDVGVHGGDVQNAAGLARHHILGKGLGGQEGALEVQLEYEVYAGSIQIKEGSQAAPSCRSCGH